MGCKAHVDAEIKFHQSDFAAPSTRSINDRFRALLNVFDLFAGVGGFCAAEPLAPAKKLYVPVTRKVITKFGKSVVFSLSPRRGALQPFKGV
jgi:hypothetical protein